LARRRWRARKMGGGTHPWEETTYPLSPLPLRSRILLERVRSSSGIQWSGIGQLRSSHGSVCWVKIITKIIRFLFIFSAIGFSSIYVIKRCY